MTRNIGTQPRNAQCNTCQRMTVEAEWDYETRDWTWWGTCSTACAQAAADRPYCHTPACRDKVCGTPTHIVNGPAVAAGQRAVYACDNCGQSGNAIWWAVQSSYRSGVYDVNSGHGLVPVRSKGARERISYTHPITRAHARAYLLGVAHAETGRVVGSQCRYCTTPYGHDYAHPHVVRASNDSAVRAWNLAHRDNA